MATRALRGLVPVEVVALVAVALAPWPERIPLALPLVVAAAVSRWVRGRALIEVTGARGMWIGAAVGAVALAGALLVGTPAVEGITDRAVMWAGNAVVRGNASLALAVALVAAVTAFAMELALRGWVLERARELGASAPIAIGIAALADALATPGGVLARLGALVFGAGLGWLYVGGGRRLAVPAAARATFAVGLVALDALRVI